MGSMQGLEFQVQKGLLKTSSLVARNLGTWDFQCSPKCKQGTSTGKDSLTPCMYTGCTTQRDIHSDNRPPNLLYYIEVRFIIS